LDRKGREFHGPSGRLAALSFFSEPWSRIMLYYTLVFLVVALIAGALGFGGVASASGSIARILFGLFLILFLVSLVMQLVGRA